MQPELSQEPVGFEKFIAKWFFRIAIVLAIFSAYVWTSHRNSLEQQCSEACLAKGFPCHHLTAGNRYARIGPNCYCLTEAEQSKGYELKEDRKVF